MLTADVDQREGAIAETAACMVAGAIFPAFFVYHMLAAWGVIPLFIGNAWSLLNIVGFVVLTPLAVHTMWRRKHRWEWHLPFAAFVALATVYVVGYRFLGSDFQRDPVLFVEGIKFVASLGCIYLIGVLLPVKEWLLRAALVALAVLVAMSIAATDKASLILDPNTWVGAPFEAANYQALARSLLPIAAIAIAFLKRSRHQAIVIGPTLLALFLIGGRSEFAGGVVLASAWALAALLRWRFRQVALSIAVTVAFFGLCLTGLWAVSAINPNAETNRRATTVEGSGTAAEESPVMPSPTEIAPRQMEMVNVEGSASWQHRTRLLHEGWSAIVKSPIAGDYGGQMRSGGFGDYIHNALSSWRQFGILGFILYVGGCVGAFLFSAKAVLLDRSDDPRLLLAFYWSSMSLVMIAMFKAVFWTLPLLGWGLVAGYLAVRRRTQWHVAPDLNVEAIKAPQ